MKIAISYRDEGWGKGTFFDHFTVRAMTAVETVICKPDSHSIINFANYINSRAGRSYSLPLSAEIPEVIGDFAESAGFIFIPGYTRDSDDKMSSNHTERLAYEQKLISKARLRGQPVLAVCAGSWTLWETFNGTTEAVSDHNYGGAMPRMSKSNPKVCNNKMIHKVIPVAHTYLSGAAKGCEPFAVNSVHWKAPSDSSTQALKFLEVSARSQKADDLAPRSRQGHKMEPSDCIEAFETKFGVPMMGIQWHPEAFNPDEEQAIIHQAIFSFMASAGRTYLNRKALNQEFKMMVSKSRSSFFSTKEEVSEPMKPPLSSGTELDMS